MDHQLTAAYQDALLDHAQSRAGRGRSVPPRYRAALRLLYTLADLVTREALPRLLRAARRAGDLVPADRLAAPLAQECTEAFGRRWPTGVAEAQYLLVALRGLLPEEEYAGILLCAQDVYEDVPA